MKKKKHIKRINWIIKKGFGCCDLYNFNYEFAKFLAAALNQFRKEISSYPMKFDSFKKWEEFIKKIVDDIEQYIQGDFSSVKEEAKKLKIAHNAIKRFAEHWPSFWK